MAGRFHAKGRIRRSVAWGIGEWFGPTDDVVAHARAVGEGVTFDARGGIRLADFGFRPKR